MPQYNLSFCTYPYLPNYAGGGRHVFSSPYTIHLSFGHALLQDQGCQGTRWDAIRVPAKEGTDGSAKWWDQVPATVMAISIPHKIITSSLPGRLDEVRGESSLLSYSSELSSCVFPSEKDLFPGILCKIHLVMTELPSWVTKSIWSPSAGQGPRLGSRLSFREISIHSRGLGTVRRNTVLHAEVRGRHRSLFFLPGMEFG